MSGRLEWGSGAHLNVGRDYADVHVQRLLCSGVGRGAALRRHQLARAGQIFQVVTLHASIEVAQRCQRPVTAGPLHAHHRLMHVMSTLCCDGWFSVVCVLCPLLYHQEVQNAIPG